MDVPDEIKCKICKKPYEDPRLLPCLHTYCKACLKQSVQTDNGKLYLFCRVCYNKVTFSKRSDLENLKSNVMISNLLLIANESPKICKSCDETATSRCVKCSDFLCGNCVEAHKQNLSTKEHRVVEIKNLNVYMVESTPCATHSQKALEMFCDECRKPVCASCISGEEHKDHPLISMEDAVDDINKLLVRRAYILQRQLEEVNASKEKLESNVQEARKEIQASLQRILTAVLKQENDLFEWLNRIRDTRRNKLESKEQALKNDLAQVLESCNLSGREDHADAVPGTAESKIRPTLEEKQVLDTLKKCLQFVLTDFPELDGTFSCGIGQCKTCSYIDSSTVISAPKSKFYIKQHFTCRSKHVIYCISCTRCDLLYIGQTKNHLSDRFGNHRNAVELKTKSDQSQPFNSGDHRNAVEKPKSDQSQTIVGHFSSGDHGVSDMKVRALLSCSDDKTRQEIESDLIKELGTLIPHGLNIKP